MSKIRDKCLALKLFLKHLTSYLNASNAYFVKKITYILKLYVLYHMLAPCNSPHLNLTINMI